MMPKVSRYTVQERRILGLCAKLDAVRAENDSLRAALREIAKGAPKREPRDVEFDSMDHAETHGGLTTHYCLAEIARRALTASRPPTTPAKE